MECLKVENVTQFLEFLPVIYAFLIYPTVLHLAREISAEIDAGLKDFMRVMGLSSSVFFLTHGFIAWVKAAVIFTICAYPIMTSLEFVPWHLVLVVVYLYSFAVIAFSMLCSSLLKTSNNVLKLAIVAWVVSVGATFIRRPSLDQYVHCYFYSLNLNHAFRLAIEIMAEACNREYHLGWPQIFDTPKIAFNLFGAMLMLLIDFVWMTAAALIIDDIRTNEESYFLTIFKKRQNNTTIGNGRRNPELEDQIDFVRQESGADIRVDGLRKMYHTGNWALEGMNLRANRGQITVLLGHNGAGKSTTFSIICGLIEPTHGEVHVTEKPVGLCPQKNSLFDKLTVRETIWFFHQLKGSDTDYKQETDEYLKALHFEDKADDLVQNLSGGTKRKLCVAVAICGESQAVLLDEPTAGMDPGARRDVENLLQHIKPHRTILLTTHYMDEAERLGDWIYIMQAGKDIINGSPGYLKKQYGTGFVLTLVSAAVVGGKAADTATPVTPEDFNLAKDLDLTAVSPIKCTMQADPNRTRHEIDVYQNYLKTHCAQFLWIDAKTSFDQRIFDEPKYLPALGVGVRLLADGTRAIFNAHGYHTAPAAMHLVANARLRHFTGKPSASIHSSIQVYAPLKDARQHQADAAAEDQVKNFLLIPVLILAFSLVSSTFVMFHVEERASHFKHQQLLTKLHPSLFWASSLLYDAVIFFTVCLVSIGVFYLAGWMQGALQYVFLLWALYFWACCPFIYSVSYLFESPSKASTLLILWQLITSIFALIVEAIQFAMAPESSDWTGTFLVFLLPPYAMGNGMKAIAMWKVFRELPPDFASFGSTCNRTDLWAWCMLGRPAAMMFFFGLASWVLFVCLSSRHISRGFSTLWGHIPFKNAPPRMDGERDVDVENEERYVAEPLISRPQLVVRKLKKVYGWNFSKPAVNELTFAVDKGQCFGLLGVNGAGKTTTIDIITGLRYATSGSIEILGEDGPTTVPIGYCPQFDAVLLDLTGRETLELMACFHGYKEPEKIASEALSAVGMLGHGDKQLRYCSGGQRRKISRVDDAMKQTFSGAVMREAGESLTVSWQIPATATTTWSSLWQKMVDLAPRGNNLEIVDYSITQCSLEDTFLNLLGNEQRADLEMDSRTRATPPTQAASSNA
ncbi:unnamed protein product, partial [Mesorhabditis spiculigera]